MRRAILPIVTLVAISILGFFLFNQRQPEPEMGTSMESPSISENKSPASTPAEPTSTLPPTTKEPDLKVNQRGLSNATVWMETNKGVIKFKFYSKDAPKTVARIVELINTGFYNGLKFHRVVPTFVIQGGDPKGNGTGGSGQKLKAEFNRRTHQEGTVAMARASDPDSADSQFYISLGKHPHLDRKYTVFGQVIEGMEVVNSIQIGDRMVKVIIQN